MLPSVLDLLPPWNDIVPTQWPSLELAAFSDDIELPTGGRLRLRCVLQPGDAGGYVADFTDSDPATVAPLFAVPVELVQWAVTLAFGRALGVEGASRAIAERLSLRCDATSFVGHSGSVQNGSAAAMTMARIFDAVAGALAQRWTTRVGAGSCSLGAIVHLVVDGVARIEVLPGGEGARAGHHGADAWPSPLLGTHLLEEPAWSYTVRPESGGGGAFNGGNGIIRTYTFSRETTVTLCTDRVKNPPHGLDRAGPPRGTRFEVRDATGVALVPWTPTMLPAGSTLEVQTCGGAGYGFPGYGDIEFDPSMM